ncbi:sensor histidine kinase [Anaerosporobacter faecicola]|uniref:sensor histidine kinase n=1 Tax=Anaerosporobacter faecicola TaxID=2718714 RepID=UPI00143A407D|nr:sensor histidine kinase [Anaerosporobacter faecicola]
MAKIPFNVDAYTAKLIGRENVSKLDGAILELVKNTYDADASICILYFEKTTNTLYIADNGTGMTENVILKHWMTIGSSSKKINFKTQKGRIQTGAKGIGRFALDRIADNCSLLTISKEEHLLWNVDWNVFEFGQKITDVTAELDKSKLSFTEFLEDVQNNEVIELIRKSFLKTGSVFRLTNLRDNWDKTTIDSIRSNLKTLIPPEFKEVFNIYFFESDTSIGEAALLQDGDDFSYDYRIKFSVCCDGNVKITINRDEFDFGNNFDKITTEAGFDSKEKAYFRGTPIVIDTTFTDVLRSKVPIDNSIGDFEGTLYYAKLTASKVDREKYYYKDITGRPDIRDSFGGIRIYRDGFRVRPYGDPKSSAVDWLMLAVRKNKSPAAISHPTGSWRVNADQMHGSIYISRTNITLPDQANRQGIVETEEFQLLQDFLKNVIRLFERDRQFVCRTLDAYYEFLHPTAVIEKELDDKIKQEAEKKKVAKRDNSNYLPEYMEVNKVSALVEKKDSTIKQLETELQMLRVLATTGIVTNTYIHEIKEITHKLGMKITMAKEALQYDKNPDAAYEYVLEANEIRHFFTSWFKVTVDSVRRDKRTMRKTDVGELIAKLVSDWQLALSPKKIVINCEVDNIVFKCFPYEIESILNNLIANSASSFDATRVGDKIIDVRIGSIDDGIIIKYSDSGIGLTGEYKDNPRLILEPFESDKCSANGEIIGTGMGMWIINRIVNEYNGSIDLSENSKNTSGFYVTLILNAK